MIKLKEKANGQICLQNGNTILIKFYYDFDVTNRLEKAYNRLKSENINDLIAQAYKNKKVLTCYNNGIIY